MGAKKKYYAVKMGKCPGIYLTWEDCKAQVIGFKGAVYKGFETSTEAKEYLEEKSEVEKVDKAEVVAYVDGSYNEIKEEYSYGAVIFYAKEELHFSESFADKENASLRNVAGELEGAKKVMRFCAEHEAESLDIYYDYRGIEDWCSGQWKAKTKYTREYKELFDEIKDKVKIRFCKVKAHTGNKYNELADKLANRAFDQKKATANVEQIEKIEKRISIEISNVEEFEVDKLISYLESSSDIEKVDVRETLSRKNIAIRISGKLECKYNLDTKKLEIEASSLKLASIVIECMDKNQENI